MLHAQVPRVSLSMYVLEKRGHTAVDKVIPQIQNSFLYVRTRMASAEAQWGCPTCTFINESTHLACAMCQSPKAQDDEAAIRQLAARHEGGKARGGARAPQDSAGGRKNTAPMQPSQTQSGSQTRGTSAPPNSFAALVSKSIPTGPPVAKAPLSNASTAKPVMRSPCGDVIECTTIQPGQWLERKDAFHLVVKRLPGSLTCEEMAKQLTAELHPFSIKRVVMCFYDDQSHERPGPSDDAAVRGKVYVEMHPAKGLQAQMIKLIGFGEDVLTHKGIITKPFDWSRGSLVVPHFANLDVLGEDGKRICPFAEKCCKKFAVNACNLAHFPEGWGIKRFDGIPVIQSKPPFVAAAQPSVEARALTTSAQAPSVVSTSSPASVQALKAMGDQVIEENIRLMEEARRRKEEEAKAKACSLDAANNTSEKRKAEQVQMVQADVGAEFCCNACGEDRPGVQLGLASGDSNKYCTECVSKGVPKVECSQCFLKTYASELLPDGHCRTCAEEAADSWDDQPKIQGQHHVRLKFLPGTVLSRHEVTILLESTVGPVKAMEFSKAPATGTPVGCRVQFAQWNYPAMAPIVRALIPPTGLAVQVDDHPNQSRVEELWRLVPHTLQHHEFTLLESSYRGKRA